MWQQRIVVWSEISCPFARRSHSSYLLGMHDRYVSQVYISNTVCTSKASKNFRHCPSVTKYSFLLYARRIGREKLCCMLHAECLFNPEFHLWSKFCVLPAYVSREIALLLSVKWVIYAEISYGSTTLTESGMQSVSAGTLKYLPLPANNTRGQDLSKDILVQCAGESAGMYSSEAYFVCFWWTIQYSNWCFSCASSNAHFEMNVIETRKATFCM